MKSIFRIKSTLSKDYPNDRIFIEILERIFLCSYNNLTDIAFKQLKLINERDGKKMLNLYSQDFVSFFIYTS